MTYLLLNVWLALKKLEGRFLMRAASHCALLKVKRVQLTDRSRTSHEVIHQLCLMKCHLLWSECLWVEVHYSHGVALCVGPHCDLSPVSPRVEHQAGLQCRQADKFLVAISYQFVLLRHVEQVVSFDTDNVSLPARAHVEADCLWISIHTSIHRKRGLVAVAIPNWGRQDR